MVLAYTPTPRPWLSLYGHYLKKAAPADQESHEQVPLALIQHLPDEISFLIFGRLPPYMLGKVACVCKQWKCLTEHPRLWEDASLEAFQLNYPNKATLQKLVTASFRRSWKKLFLEMPHLRFDGLYVSRNSYIRNGVAEFRNHRPVHVVIYYRYYRFFPDGTLLYRTSPSTVKQVSKSMMGAKSHFLANDGVTPAPHTAASHLFLGKYQLKGTKVRSIVRYPNNRMTEIRCIMTLRSTVEGANNRLDMEALFSYDRELHRATTLDGAQALQPNGQPQDNPYALDDDGPPPNGITHRRGLASCVFVPWDQVQTSVLNLPASQMDFYCPG